MKDQVSLPIGEIEAGEPSRERRPRRVRKISGVAAEVPKPREGILSQSETQYQLLFDGNPVPMWMFERETLKFLDVNEAAIRHYGFSKEEFLSMTIADIRPAEDVERLLEHVAVAIHGLQEAELWRHRKKDGTIIDVEIVSHNMDFHGTPAELVAAHDVTRRMQTEEALRKAEEKYRTIFENAVIGIMRGTLTGRPLNVNRAFAQMHGYSSSEEFLAEVSDVGRQVFVDPMQLQHLGEAVSRGGAVTGAEVQVYRKDGSTRWASVNLRGIPDASGAIALCEGTVEDITDRKLAEERVQYLAYHDALTGLANHLLLKDRLIKTLAAARRHQRRLAILFLDIDGFKVINDSLGHSFGDLLLQEAAKRLTACTRSEDTVARIGGDEFLIALTDVADVNEPAVAARRIMDSMKGEFAIQGYSFNITCSVGISIFPDHGEDAETLIKNADAAMYCAKDNGRNALHVFTEEMNAQLVERLKLEHALRCALERNELYLVYQPQLELASERIIGFEALLRWKHPQLGLILPDRFIPIAEATGLIIPIGEWVLRTACAQARAWQEDGFPALPVAVNVSALQFRQDGFRDVVKAALRDSRLDPQYLELELTESVLLSNADVTPVILRELKAMGVKLAIDDFGIGYSSLSYLRQFPVDKLKIDRSFIEEVVLDEDDAAITSAIISMARALNLKTVAEGVENDAQACFLRAHHCDQLQGYLLAKPMTASDVAELLLMRVLPADGPSANTLSDKVF